MNLISYVSLLESGFSACWITVEGPDLSFAVQSSPHRPNQEHLTSDGVSWDQSGVDPYLLQVENPCFSRRMYLSSAHHISSWFLKVITAFLAIFFSHCLHFVILYVCL